MFRALLDLRGASHAPRNDCDHAECEGVSVSHYSGIGVAYKMRNISKSLLWIFSQLSGFLALAILARHAKNQGRSQMKILS